MNAYDLILDGRYHLRELIEQIVIEDSLDEIAMRADVRLTITPDLPAIEPGMRAEIHGVLHGDVGSPETPPPIPESDDKERLVEALEAWRAHLEGKSQAEQGTILLAPGVVWEAGEDRGIHGHLSLCIYDMTIYLAKSEDEYLLPAGQTATQRIKQYARDWLIPLGQVADTGTVLAKAVYRAQPIYSMLRADLIETASKGGDLYRPRMSPNGLELVKLGSNTQVWRLAAGESIETMSRKSTLEGAVTQVKVLGHASEKSRSPVLALVKGETEKYGTLQQVIQNSKITTAAAAKTAGQKALAGVQQTITVSAPDVNVIRAGDRVNLNGEDVYVVSIKHELGNPGRMVLSLADIEYIRRRFYAA